MDTIEAVADTPQEVVQRVPGSRVAHRVDVYAVALYLFAQLYIRQAQRPDAMDVWPSSSPQATAAAATAVSRLPVMIQHHCPAPLPSQQPLCISASKGQTVTKEDSPEQHFQQLATPLTRHIF